LERFVSEASTNQLVSAEHQGCIQPHSRVTYGCRSGSAF
jgi:hypothetical protein